MLTEEEQEKISEAIFMVSFETALQTLRERGFDYNARLTGMIRAMTTVIRMLDKEGEED